jgi:hypothetical protein
VIVADELVLVREPQRGLLEPADQQHLFEQSPSKLFVQRSDMTMPLVSLFPWFGFPDMRLNIPCYGA